MTRARPFAIAIVAILAVWLVSRDGTAASFVTGLFGPRVALEVTQPGGHVPGAPGQPGAHPGAPAGPPVAGVPAAAARVFSAVAVQPAPRADQGYAIEARIVGKDGKALAGVVVGFYDVRELLGTREMLIATATTDGFGTAEVRYLPAEAGSHVVVARPLQWDRLAATQATATFAAERVAPAAYARERLPLESFTRGVPAAAAAVLIGVWALFAFVVLGSAYRIPRGARRTPRLSQAREL